ncbi:MAG TPA: hypothetical protein HPP51_00730 [Planctomycetes bacterium]|nr:hypothetical protein [Planctomycetota bacterium]
MIKSLGILIGGVFIGAVGVEIIRKKYPESLDKLYAKTCEMASGAKEALKRGMIAPSGPGRVPRQVPDNKF